MDDKDITAAIEEFIGDMGYDFHYSEQLRHENAELRNRIKLLAEDYQQSHEQVMVKSNNNKELIDRIDALNKEKVQFMEELGQSFVSKSQIVELRYEV